jgi:hypothetical protein
VIAEVQAESGWKPTAFRDDSNGGSAGLYQLNQLNWITAGGQPWATTPPPQDADVLQPDRHLQLAIPWVCANLRTATAHLAAAGKTTTPLDAMLVCHIAGCGRVTNSRTGIPTPGEARCDQTCAQLITSYIDRVHHYVDQYSTPAGPADIADLPVPVAYTGRGNGCAEDDPTTSGCLTPATLNALDQVIAAFGPVGLNAPIHAVSCWDPHLQNPTSDHPKGRACDLFPIRAGTFPAGTELKNGWRLATWLRAHADALNVKYLIWQGRYWDPTTGDQDGWGTPYSGGGIYNPTNATGGHFDHVHLSIR